MILDDPARRLITLHDELAAWVEENAVMLNEIGGY
jgi:hypothetical protein